MSIENYGGRAVIAGPWGGGEEGFYWDDGVHTNIRQLFIAHGDAINSIRIAYDDGNGSSTWSEKHGGNGGAKFNTVNLEHPDEFLTSIRGYYGNLLHDRGGPVVILSLTFLSNRRTYGPYGGGQRGSPFSFNGKIVGFLGKCGQYLYSIGAYVEPLLDKHKTWETISHTVEFEHPMMQGSFNSNIERMGDDEHKSPLDPTKQASRDLSYTKHKKNGDHQKIKTEKIPSKNDDARDGKIQRFHSANAEGVVTYGPWGGNGGSMFDDGALHDGIKQINLKRNVCIVSIEVRYVLRNGKSVWGNKNGGKGSFKKDKIVLEYPSEMLTHVTGYHGPAAGFGPDVIKSLTFHTTKGRYGPYGEEQGRSFSTNLRQGSVVLGFHGRKGLFIDAIGVHVIEGKLLM